MKVLCALSLAAALFAVPNFAKANNPGVGPGEAGYVYWKPLFFFKGGYTAVIQGPGNYGWGPFHYEVQVIQTRSETQDEKFEVIDVNQVKIHFEVHFLMRPDPNRIKEIVEEFGGANWYNTVVQAPLRTFVRDAVGAQDSQTLSTSQDKIQANVDEAARKWLKEKNMPFFLDQVSVGNFQFPDVISDAAAEKQASLQRLAAKSTQLEIAHKDAEIEVARSEGIRKSQDIINSTLSPIYVQHEMVQAIERIAEKKGNAVIYVPLDKNGLPMVGNMDVRPASTNAEKEE